jgi:peroxiredoxin Q/BCP
MIPRSAQRRSLLAAAAAAAAAALAGPTAGAQAAVQVAAQSAARSDSVSLQVGQVAPDFALAGATRYGLLRSPVRLSDMRGKTVVLAFFFKARTKG